jgi:hypothetical protein
LVVGGANGLAGDSGLRGRLCWAALSVTHDIHALISASGMAEPAPWYVYVRAATGLPAKVFRLLPMLPVGMATVGIGSIRAAALGGWGFLPLVIGLFGWAYQLTDSDGIFRMGYAHVVFGVVYSLSWIVPGCLLCPKRTGTTPHTSPE